MSQIKEYDIGQKILKEFTNIDSRLILFSIVKQSQTAACISGKSNIPLSTVYKKLQNLEDLTLVFVEKIGFSEVGSEKKYYRSRVKGINISISNQEPRLILLKNKI